MLKPLSLTVGAVFAAIAIAACGSSSSSTPAASSSGSTTAASASGAYGSTSSTPASTSSTPASTSSAGGTVLAISAATSGQLMFSTNHLTAKAGKVTINFTNHAPEAHDLSVQVGTNGTVLGATGAFQGGTKRLVLNLKAGTYTYFCNVPGHRQAGMHGTLTVTS